MPKSLEIKILERQLKLAALELARLEGVETHNELDESEYVKKVPVYDGPEYLEVRASLWNTPHSAVEGKPCTLEQARGIARKKGLKGISIKWGKK
jgi:hypothetical protein